MNIGFIGIGHMGAGMARRLVEAGHTVTVYNRTADKTLVLKNLGATLASTPAESARTADVLITMVKDDLALEAIMWGPNGALETLPKDAIHVSMSTISDELANKLSAAHAKTHTRHVGAPVFGRPPAAAEGKLFIVAAGDGKTLDACEPIFQVLGQKTIRMGEKPSVAHLTKIMGNFMLFSAIQSMAEAIAHVKAAGLNERTFLEAMTSTIFTAPIYKNYGTMMVEENFTMPGAVSMNLALKDVRLALQSSATEKTVLPTALLLQRHLTEGISRGYGDHDVSSLTQLMKELK